MRQPSLPGDMLGQYYGHDGHLGHMTPGTADKIFLASTRISYIWFHLVQSFKELEIFIKYTDRCLFPLLLT